MTSPRSSSSRALARAVREAVRLDLITLTELGDTLPLERARSGAEIRALELLREHRQPLPRLNVRIAGEEADLSWPSSRLIVEIDGGPFHLDVGEDARKQELWEAAGWTVRRVFSDDVYEHPPRLLALAPPSVPESPA